MRASSLVILVVLVGAAGVLGCHPVAGPLDDGGGDGDGGGDEADPGRDAETPDGADGGAEPDGGADPGDGGDGGDGGGDGGDGGAEADADSSHGCEVTDDCLDPAASVCLDGGCVPCADREGCAHLGATPVCDGGRCVACTTEDTAGCPPSAPACDGGRCVLCTADDESACPPSAPRCEPSTHGCVECVEAADCDDLVACSVDDCVDGACVADRDLDDDGSDCFVDCDDADPGRFPGNPERCDGVDNDCDGAAERDFAIDLAATTVSAGAAEPIAVALAWSGAVHALAWCDAAASPTGEPRTAILDADGSVVARPSIAAPSGDCEAIEALWTGSTFVVVWDGGCGVVRAAVVSPAGAVTTGPTEIATGPGLEGLAAAHGGSGRLAVLRRWTDRWALQVYDDALAPVGAETTRSARMMLLADVAARSDGFLALSYEAPLTGSDRQVRAQAFGLDGAPGASSLVDSVNPDFHVLGLSAAPTSAGYLAAWTRLASRSTVRVATLSAAGAPTSAVSTVLDGGGALYHTFCQLAPAEGRGGPAGVGGGFVAYDAAADRVSAYAFSMSEDGLLLGPPTPVAGLADVDGSLAPVAVSPAAPGMALATADRGGGAPGGAFFSTLETCF